MPQRPASACAAPGCPAIVWGGRWCDKHQPPPYEQARLSPSRRGYGRTWQKLRLMFLRANPLCADPFGVHGNNPVAGTDVDHVIPRAQGGTDAFDNLQSLCRSCHSRKTAMSDGRWGDKGRGG